VFGCIESKRTESEKEKEKEKKRSGKGGKQKQKKSQEMFDTEKEYGEKEIGKQHHLVRFSHFCQIWQVPTVIR